MFLESYNIVKFQFDKGWVDLKRTIRNNINQPYTLHDMNVISFEITDNDIVMRTQSGMVETTTPYRQLDGYIEFHNVQWDRRLTNSNRSNS